MENHWELGRWSGIPVSLHWTVLLIFPWLYAFTGSFMFALIGSLAYVVVLIVHEFGHVAVARWRGHYVESIDLQGLHGRTALGSHASHRDEIAIAWGGVGAQAIVLAATLVFAPMLDRVGNYWVAMVAGPVILMFTKWNIFLMVAALLPIGPMDGHKAWAVIPLIRQRLRKKRKVTPKKLTAEQEAELEKKSKVIAADIIKKISEVD